MNIKGGRMVRVTGTVTVGVEAEASVMLPLKVPGARPTGLTVTVTAPGVVEEAGETASQLPVEDAAAVKGMDPPLVTFRVWAGGAGVAVPAGPCCVLNVRDAGEGSRAVVTVRVTGILRD